MLLKRLNVMLSSFHPSRIKSMRRRILVAALTFTTIIVLMFGAAVFAQSPAPNQDNLDLSGSLQRITQQAVQLVPAFVRTVEKPLGGYFDMLAYYFALLFSLVYFFKILREKSGADFEDVGYFVARFAVIFALLGYCGDVNGDGVRGDLLNRIGSFGNSVAYGNLSTSNQSVPTYRESFIGQKVNQQKEIFSANYKKFLENKFMYKVNNEDTLIRYPDESNRGYQMLSALYSQKDSLQTVTDNFNPEGWKMNSLFQFLNISRGIVEFGDLFLIILQGFIVACLRLALPFMIAVAIDKEFAKRISINFAWGAGIALIVMPIISQLVRYFAYTAGNLAMDAGSSQPYFKYDPTTATVVANGHPEYIIIICALVMTISGLCMFASPYISYRLAQGGVLEAITGVVSGWMGSMISTGISVFSTAAAQAINKQAEQVTAYGQQQAEKVSAGANLTAGDINAQAQLSSRLQESRAQLFAESSNAGITAYEGNQRALAEQQRLQTEQMAQVQATDVVENAKMQNATMTAQKDLDDVLVNNSGPASALTGVIDNALRSTVGYGDGAGKNLNDLSKQGVNQAANTQGATTTTTTTGTPDLANSNLPYTDTQCLNQPVQKPLGFPSTGYADRDRWLQQYGAQYGADPLLMYAMMGQESSGNKNAESPKGAKGLMQLMPGTAARFGVTNVFDPEQNIKGGAAYVGFLTKFFQERGFQGEALRQRVLAAYNAGESAVWKKGANGQYYDNYANVRQYHNTKGSKEWTDTTGYYVDKISANYDQYANRYNVPESAQTILQAYPDFGTRTRAVRDAVLGLNQQARLTVAESTAARIRANTTIGAGQIYQNQIMATNNAVADMKIAVARQTEIAREQAAQTAYQGQIRSNKEIFYGQMGNPNAAAGTPENAGAIRIRYEAAQEAARLRATAAVMNTLGSSISQAATEAFKGFNRF